MAKIIPIDEHFQHFLSELKADVQNALGETEQAFKLLMRGYDERDMWMIYLEVDPHMDSLRRDTRFEILSQKIGLSRRFAP